MIKLKSIIYLLIFAFFSINKAHANTPVQCFDFIEQYKNLEFARLGTQRPIDTFEDFGFSFNFDPSEKAELLSTDFTSQVRRITMSEREEGIKKNEDLPRKMRDHALFVGYFPHDKPRFAFSVIVEHGGSGSKTAAPIARDICKELIKKI